MDQKLSLALNREMSRKQFLHMLGLGILSIIGFSTIVDLLTGKNSNHWANSGYGSGMYGGNSVSQTNAKKA